MRSQLKNYLSVSKKEWNGLVVLIILLILILAAPYIYQLFGKDNTINVNDFNAAVAQLDKAKANDLAGGGVPGDEEVTNPIMFNFDPNHLPAEKWRALGLNNKQISMIEHYEEKGGRFRYREDMKKIYAINAGDYKRLAPYITLPSSEVTTGNSGLIIELNSADSLKLTQLPGIWPSFATRIIHYRERLGGFYRKEQLREVFGMDDEKYNAIKNFVRVNPHAVKRININKVDFSGLSHFPYLSFKQMNAVIAYREQHGEYESIADLGNIAILDKTVLHKVEPYLLFK